MNGNYPDTFYRVSVKAIIRNAEGKILVVQEGNADDWSLPGGGLSHNEDIHEALRRELYEETLIDSPFSEKFLGSESTYVPEKGFWSLWLIYEVTIDSLNYGIGKDAIDVAFKNPMEFKNSTLYPEKIVYKFSLI